MKFILVKSFFLLVKVFFLLVRTYFYLVRTFFHLDWTKFVNLKQLNEILYYLKDILIF